MSKVELGIVVTLVLAAIGGALFIGELSGRVRALEGDKDYSSVVAAKRAAIQEIKTLRDASKIGASNNCTWHGITNISGGHQAAIEGQEWEKVCSDGFYAKGFKLSTYGQKSTYHHYVQCCAF